MTDYFVAKMLLELSLIDFRKHCSDITARAIGKLFPFFAPVRIGPKDLIKFRLRLFSFVAVDVSDYVVCVGKQNKQIDPSPLRECSNRFKLSVRFPVRQRDRRKTARSAIWDVPPLPWS